MSVYILLYFIYINSSRSIRFANHFLLYFIFHVLIDISSSSVWWLGVVIWSCTAEHLFLPHVWFEYQKGIDSSIICFEKIDLVEPIPLQVEPQPMFSNLKAWFGHLHSDTIEGTFYLGCWLLFRKPSVQWYCGCIYNSKP